MDDHKLDKIYSIPQIEIQVVGHITEKEKFHAAKQILLGLAILYVITLTVSLYRVDRSADMIDLCKTVFPSLATFILGAYFRDRTT